ncbi:uncharacterized protein LOC129573208 isoform X2 [Sitodiplosis mosellana]|uniref:uncharacterized protein LOC129573208 isoform X2 n=1 Tax=Sitodiplosis mosellana TaxID=263140 RepID=UPI0024444FC5|nr:uncharacterized protein LOC129573208 isoform X2 [Sitodiplosis mosellana]XP_055309500.1 uncharacterized protein LOC129573208 isoform X2 [Sitodiplosis mosellana]XP_055309501.1 uncharacterized protein LOC129573208 isoform X2 [Sitodiplosis mosellana]
MFKQHLEMIGRNETPSKKAKFWQSYVRSLKGSDDIRAHDSPRVSSWRPLSADLPPLRSIYDEPSTASERIIGTGYRYLPVHRETYGYSPRPIYSHHYGRPSGDYAHVYDAERAWHEHLQRMKEIERRYPSRYGLYLKDKPSTVVLPQEFEPELKPIKFSGRAPSASRAVSVPPIAPAPLRSLSIPPRDLRATSVPPFPHDPLSPLDLLSEYDAHRQRCLSPTPVKCGRWAPRSSEVAFDSDGLPIYRGGWPRYNNLDNILSPRPKLPITAITRDPFWYDLGDLGLRPFRATSELPPSLRDSYLSPIKRRYLWTKHPMRPFGKICK